MERDARVDYYDETIIGNCSTLQISPSNTETTTNASGYGEEKYERWSVSSKDVENDESEDERRMRRRKANVLLVFASLLALTLILFYNVNTRRFAHSIVTGAAVATEWWRVDPRIAQLHIPSIGSLLYGRRLLYPSDDGDYFTNIHYTRSVFRFYQPRLAELRRGETHFTTNDQLGCPNAYPHTNLLNIPVASTPYEPSCNTLNVYRCTTSAATKKSADGKKKLLTPVLVYVHEGGWFSRSNSNLHPPSVIRKLACRGGERVLIVSMNYRIGPYGHFNAHRAQYNADRSRGYTEEGRNFALQDIRTGLKWVRHNARHFGGNASHVTVMARGRGAQLVSLLSYSEAALPRRERLIHQLVLFGGSSHTPTLYEYEMDDTDDWRGYFGSSSNAEKGGNRSSSRGNSSDGERVVAFPLHNYYDSSMEFALAANCTHSERDWLLAMWNLLGQEEGVRDSNALFKCLQSLSRETIEEVEAKRPYAETFIRWPIVVGGRSPLHTLRPPFVDRDSHIFATGKERRNQNKSRANKTSTTASAPTRIPTIMGICRRTSSAPIATATATRGNNKLASGKQPEGISPSMTASLQSALNAVRDLKSLPYASRVIDYYVEAFRQGWLPAPASLTDDGAAEQQPKMDKVLAELMEQVRHDFTSVGPVLLEVHRRGGGLIEKEHDLQVDIANGGLAEAYRHEVHDTSAQLPCIDDFLFNPLDKKLARSASSIEDTLRKQSKLVDVFADYLVNFIQRGDPNASSREKPATTKEKPRPNIWPQISPLKRGSSSSTTLGTTVLRLRGDNGYASYDYLPTLYSEEHLRFWLCEMAANMGIAPHPWCSLSNRSSTFSPASAQPATTTTPRHSS